MSPDTTSTRSRRPAGTPIGGQFAPEIHAEPEVAIDSRASAPPGPEPAGARAEVASTRTEADGEVRWINEAGHLHRTDGPAVERAYGQQEWWLHGQPHRTDGPAILCPEGYRAWWVNGVRHRLDGPAVDYASGLAEWWVNGVRHRLDGPAVVSPRGDVRWFVDGKEVEVGGIDRTAPVSSPRRGHAPRRAATMSAVAPSDR